VKYLIVNADDFGYSQGINKGIIEAHTKGVVTSTSLMVDAIAADEASGLSKYPNLSVGLHFVLESSPNIKLSRPEIQAEFDRQLNKFKETMGRQPSHIDTHKISPPENKDVEQVLRAYCGQVKVPIRGFGFAKLIESFFGLNIDGTGTPDRQKISPDAFKKALDEATDQYNEMFCHPGYSDEYLRAHSSYNEFREIELKTVTDPSLKQYIKDRGFTLCNWSKIKP